MSKARRSTHTNPRSLHSLAAGTFGGDEGWKSETRARNTQTHTHTATCWHTISPISRLEYFDSSKRQQLGCKRGLGLDGLDLVSYLGLDGGLYMHKYILADIK